ncbi:vps9-ankyrin repeat-containing protein [Fusarium austroafricanum]|uniref:Vps9-ankyrin repeat-containing protein n=1 Tax=Fusarium austroafricanum TaxID=2364996 RepID=A0A8H4KAB3_9HYPO|nr:vps9-ankyrin repeat-containing protein [Fusarium austroafricanum]
MLDVLAYTIGWICTLSTEYLAAQQFFDEKHGQPDLRYPHDGISYFLGRVGRHNVVMAIMPAGESGTCSAAIVGTHLLRSFPNVRMALLVGIGGGAPRLPAHDIRLGDVVSIPNMGYGDVFQFDYGKSIQERKYVHTRSLNQHPQALLIALTGLKMRHEINGNGLVEAVERVLKKKLKMERRYGRPSSDSDLLFESDFVHSERNPEFEDDSTVHYGIITSGNTTMHHALIRDTLAKEHHVLCFDMEAAGLMNTIPCLVIRGIWNYSDTHVSTEWQGYAAMVAAAYAKDLLCYLVPEMNPYAQNLSTAASNSIGIDTKTMMRKMESDQQFKKNQAIKIDPSIRSLQSNKMMYYIDDDQEIFNNF